MLNNRKLYSGMQILILFTLFLSSMDFMLLHYYFVFIAFALCLISKSENFSFDFCSWMLFAFSISYIIFMPSATSTFAAMLKPFTYPFCYCIGRNIFSSSTTDPIHLQKQTKIGIIAVSMGAFVHYLLNFAINFDATERNNIDFWSKSIRSATGQASLAVMAVAVFVAILFSKSSKMTKLGSIVGLTLTLMYNLILSGRTLLLLTLICFVVTFLYAQTSRTKKQKIIAITIVLLTVILLVTLYNSDFLGVKTAISNSNLFKRFEVEDVSEDSRMDNKLLYIDLMFVYPFGGNMIFNETGKYAHDLYLDAYSEVGIIGILFLLIFMILSIVSVLKTIINKSVSNDMNTMLFCVFLAMMVEFMIEPILQGVQWMFCCYCFIIGMINKVIESNSCESSKEIVINENIII